MDEQTKNEILKSISLQGASLEENQIGVTIGNRVLAANNVIDRSAGLPRIRPHLVSRFNLIVTKPNELEVISSLEIRCCLCSNVIYYPTWYYVIRYKVNQMHYFVCFNPSQPNKVTAECYNPRLRDR